MVGTRSKSKGEVLKPKSTPKKATTNRKVRNKVQSPVARQNPAVEVLVGESDVESDEYDVNEEEDVVSAPPTPGVSDTESSSSRVRLPFNLQRQLLSDIQERGGIERFGLSQLQALSALCDARPELYGDRGDRVRRRIGKKVQRWRVLTPAEFARELQKYKVGVKPSKAVVREAKAALEKKAASTDDIPDSVSIPVQPAPPRSLASDKPAPIASIAVAAAHPVNPAASSKSVPAAATKPKMSTSSNTSKLSCVFELFLLSSLVSYPSSRF